MRLPKPVGELLTGYVALAVAALVALLALERGHVSAELIVTAAGLLALAVTLAVLSTRALGGALTGLLRALERLARVALPGWRWTGTSDLDRKSTRLNSSHVEISYAVFCLKKKKTNK